MKNYLYLSFIFFYIIPNSFEKISTVDIYILNRAIYNILGIAYLVILLIKEKKIKVKKREIILILIIFFRVIMLKDYESISLITLILIDRLKLKKIKLKKLFYLIFILTICYSVYFYPINFRPIATAIGEINMSGFSILILFLISELHQYKVLKILYLIMGFFTFSRNFLLAIVVNYILKSKVLRKRLLIIFNNFFIVSIFSLIMMFFIGNIYENYVLKNGVTEYQKGIKRYTTLIDNSNLYRFQANLNVIKFYKRNPNKFLTGETLKNFRQEVKINKKEYNVINVRSPHNFYYKYLLKYGIFSFYLFWYISKIIGKINSENLIYFVPYYIYSIILGVGFYDFYLLSLKYLLDIKKINIRKEEKKVYE